MSTICSANKSLNYLMKLVDCSSDYMYLLCWEIICCAVPENIHTLYPPPHRRDWNFLWGEGRVCKTKKFKEINGRSLIETSRGVGDLTKIPSLREVWIFSGTKH